ncbi:nucleoside monophosphate kinase [Candidatus Woesearchaeota archaeon]|nr:nucleoside monophosphate kinase [Candidatus Woesearchaeota archaeon]
MIITIAGTPGAGKSSVAKLVAKKLKLKHYSTGDYMRQIAIKRNISLMELTKIAEKDKSIDKELDKWQIKSGKTKDNFVIDSRLGFYFIPNSIKVLLVANIDQCIERIFQQKRTDENAPTKEAIRKKIIAREKSEKKRYKALYGLKIYDIDDFDIIIDTSDLTIKQVADRIIGYVRKQ